MKPIAIFLATLLSLAGCGSADTSSLSSNYPPDYSWGDKCAEEGPVKICRTYNYSGVYMRITYSGPLKFNEGLQAWIRLNGHEGVFPLINTGYRTMLSNNSFNCRHYYDQHGSSAFRCEQPTDAMKHLFYFARNNTGGINAWDLEIAFVDALGNWDSRYGENYKMRIEGTPY